jgi:hypothetical protein
MKHFVSSRTAFNWKVAGNEVTYAETEVNEGSPASRDSQGNSDHSAKACVAEVATSRNADIRPEARSRDQSGFAPQGVSHAAKKKAAGGDLVQEDPHSR